jgi:hypothetical protein
VEDPNELVGRNSFSMHKVPDIVVPIDDQATGEDLAPSGEEKAA